MEDNEIVISVSQTSKVDFDFVISQDHPIDFDLTQESTVEDLEISFDLGPGLKYIYADEDFYGAGTSQSPLHLSNEFWEKLNIKFGSYIHNQQTSSTTWTIHHNLNKFPSITVVNDEGYEIICSEHYVDANTCVVEMNKPYSGKAYLN